MIDDELLFRLANTAASAGGEYADVYFEHRRQSYIVLEDGRIEKAVSGTDQGVGIRIINQGRTAYAYCNDMTEPALIDCAKSLSRAIKSERRDITIDFTSVRPNIDFQISIPPDTVPMGMKIDLLKSADKAARGVAIDNGGRIRQAAFMYRDTVSSVMMATSLGDSAKDERVHTIGTVNIVAAKGNAVQTAYEPVGGSLGFEAFDDNALIAAAEKAASLALRLLNARRASGGRMPVVISSSAGGTMIHEAIGHGLEADLAGQGLSKYSGKLGSMVASKIITVMDDPTLPARRGSYGIDDEAVASRRNILVKDGELVSYMHDRLSAMRSGASPTGNGRRESYRSRPIPRMSNTIIAPGKTPADDILKATPNGLYVVKMGGGQVNTVTGDFVFDVQEGYIIEDGRMGELVRGATLAGNGPEVLIAIDMVGSDLGFSMGTCGKDGQGVPVGDAQPTLRIPEMVVGGSAG